MDRAQHDECYILIKAQPHRSEKHFETVCCAGIGRDGQWRRQYPVPFRILSEDQKFSRWNLIGYDFTRSRDDPRRESQKVIPESIKLVGNLKKSEQSKFVTPLIRQDFAESDSLRESLTLIRPRELEITGQKKTQAEILDEERKHNALSAQLSMFGENATPLKICPVAFKVKWKDFSGKWHHHECDDWETSAAYNRFERSYGHDQAIHFLKEKYQDQYLKAGLALAFSTHKRRNVEHGTTNQWLLVGMLRINDEAQKSLF
jgi:hypothetical protein